MSCLTGCPLTREVKTGHTRIHRVPMPMLIAGYVRLWLMGRVPCRLTLTQPGEVPVTSPLTRRRDMSTRGPIVF